MDAGNNKASMTNGVMQGASIADSGMVTNHTTSDNSGISKIAKKRLCRICEQHAFHDSRNCPFKNKD